MKFSQFIKKQGTYVACTFTDDSKKQLAIWCVENLIEHPLQPNKYHTTILYSRKMLKNPLQYIQLNTGMEFAISGFHLFDSSNDKSIASLVLELDAKPIKDAHDKLIAAGGTHDYEDFTPHITVSCKVPSNFDVNCLSMPTFKMVIDKVYTEPLDLDWKE